MQAGSKPLGGLHDVELAGLAALGDRDAFGQLVRRHNEGVRGQLLRMGVDRATADDVAQDAFLIAFSRIADFRGEGAFGGWVKRIAARAYIKRPRRSVRIDRMEEAARARTRDDVHGGESEATDRMDLDRALATLPQAERLCISLCYGAGFSHGEAAEALDLPLGTVKSHIRRGSDRLRQRLAPAAEQGGAHVGHRR